MQIFRKFSKSIIVDRKNEETDAMNSNQDSKKPKIAVSSSISKPMSKKCRLNPKLRPFLIFFSVSKRFIVSVAEFIISLDQSNESLVTSSLFVQDDIKSTKTLQPHLSTRFKTITRLYFHEKFRKLANITICLSRDHRFTQHQRCKLVIPRIIIC